MIRRVSSLVGHTIRAAFRSRFFAALFVLLALIVLVLPRTLRGDGTPSGELRMLLSWTLGAALGVLSVATLWAGCNAFAGEMEEGIFGSVAVTPVRRFELWLGKWLGLVLLDAFLLAGVLLGVSVQLSLRGISSSERQPFLRVAPSEYGLRAHALALVEQARSEGALPDIQDPEAWLEEILEALRDRHWPIAPGESKRWHFEVPDQRRRVVQDWRIRIAFSSPTGSANPASGRCRVLNAEEEEIGGVLLTPEDRQQVEVSFFPEQAGASNGLALLFENSAEEDGTAVLIGVSDGVLLFIPQGTFSENLVRAGLVLWALLATFAAIGVSAGALFSLPVAVFIASALSLMGLLSHAHLEDDPAGCGHDHGDHGPVCLGMNTLNRASTATLRGIAFLTGTFDEAAPLDRVGDGLVVPLHEALAAVWAVGLLLPALTGCGAVLVLRHREFP